MELLFPEPGVPSLTPRERSETTVEFFRRSTRDAVRQCRRLLNSWLEPLHADTDLLQRIVGDDQSFRGAFLETYLDASFRQARVDFQRPKLTTSAGRLETPDFVVIHGNDERCYFEATVTSPSSSNQGARQRLDRLLDKVDQMKSPNFHLIVEVHEIGPKSVAAASLVRLLTTWLDTLNPDDPASFIDLPTYTFSVDGWSISFEAATIRREHRGRPGRTIGGQVFPGGQITDDKPLMKVLKGKTEKYRTLNAPYVVVVDEDSWELSGDDDEIESMAWHRTNALYGAEAVVTSGPHSGQATRQGNGFWRRATKYQNTRVTAVLFTDHLSPHNALRAVPQLWLNPQAVHKSIPVLPLWRVVKFGWVENEEQHHVFGPATSAGEFWSGTGVA